MVQIASKLKHAVISKETRFEITGLMKTGYLLLAASLFIYALTEYTGHQKDLFTIFWCHYIIAITYTVFLIFNGCFGIHSSMEKNNTGFTVILTNLYLISAFALNREFHIFWESVDWLCWYLIGSSVTLMSFQYFKALPSWINNLQCLLIGSSMVLYAYASFYIAPFYVVGAIATLALGLGAHVFVPVILLILCILSVIHNYKTITSCYWTAGGAIVTIAFGLTFMFIWDARITRIEKLANQSVMSEEMELPVWVTLAQEIKNDWITTRILKSDLVYSTSTRTFWSRGFNIGSESWTENKKHDPLVFISSMVSNATISRDDRIRILKAIDNGRHKASERLWSGDNLSTSYVVSDIDIYPALRLAYTEKYLNIKNTFVNNGWSRGTEEGIYTFYLPEGSVVTSLSLWIDGKESKAILSSKQKAQEAYRTIVGIENRDPSVVHWQEGNTVTVRVFPCSPNEERKFKIGITSPLQVRDGLTIYQNILFDGPDASNAREAKRVRFIGGLNGDDILNNFEKDNKGDYRLESKYDPNFIITFKTESIPVNNFTFDHQTYSIENYKREFKETTFQQIYLDINNSWTDQEVENLKMLLDEHALYTQVEENFLKLDHENWERIVGDLQNRNFTVFPFHRLEDPARTLVVTKGNVHSPHLADFRESEFSKRLTGFLLTGNKVNVFNLQGGTSTYIKTLNELRAINFATGTPAELMTMFSSKTFPSVIEDEGRIVLHDANMSITKSKNNNTSPRNNAPDHLARLFAYNNIMRKAGTSLLNPDYTNEDLIKEAATAYVVSPVSSLIVLETQRDYERFGIEDSKNSLHNASKQSSGAVPEPHEWALIILLLGFIAYQKFKLYLRARNTNAQG